MRMASSENRVISQGLYDHITEVFATDALLPAMHQDLPVGKPARPRQKRPRPVVLAEVLPELRQRLLQNVIRFGSVGQQGKHEPVQRPLIHGEETGEITMLCFFRHALAQLLAAPTTATTKTYASFAQSCPETLEISSKSGRFPESLVSRGPGIPSPCRHLNQQLDLSRPIVPSGSLKRCRL